MNAEQKFRDFDPTNEKKMWWIDFLKEGNVHSYNHNEFVEECLANDDFADPSKHKKNDHIWWLTDLNMRGPLFFSFDLITIYNYYGDYPENLTPEQKQIFDRENPTLAVKNEV